jgi:hypothetical protein
MTQIVPFDYASLPEDVRSEARDAVAEYQAYEQRTIEGAAAIGHRLSRIRGQLEHGQFLAWLRAEFPAISRATAYRWMDLAENLGSELLTVRNLPQVVVYELAAQTTPDPTRGEIIAKLKDCEQIAPNEITETIRVARVRAEQEARLKALPPEEKKKEIRKEKRRRRTEEERAAEVEKQRKEYERKQKRAAKATVEIMQMLSERFSDEELRRLGELLKVARSDWIMDLLCGNGLCFCPPNLVEVFAPWKERFAPSLVPAEPEQRVEDVGLDQSSNEPEKELLSHALEDYASKREVEDLIADLDDERISLWGQGRKDEAKNIVQAISHLRRDEIPAPELGVRHPLLERVWNDVAEAERRICSEEQLRTLRAIGVGTIGGAA